MTENKKFDITQAQMDVLNSEPYNGRDMFWEQHRFARDGYLKINHLIDPMVRNEIIADAKYLLSNHSKRRDILIESTGNTPRYLSNVTRDDIERYGKYIPIAYESKYLLSLIRSIVKEDVIPTPWKWDNYIINSQHKAGDTHGWHWETIRTQLFGSWKPRV